MYCAYHDLPGDKVRVIVPDVGGGGREGVEGAVLDAFEEGGLCAGAQVEVERGGLSESLEAGPRVAGHAACGPS